MYDYVSTKNFTPDLSKETNPLVYIGGLKWNALTIILVILTMYVIYALYISIYKNHKLLPNRTGLSFKEFVPYYYFGNEERLSSLFWKFPKSFMRFNAIMGAILAGALVFAGIISTTMWILINYTTWYYPGLHFPPLLYGLILIGAVAAGYLHFRNSYAKYQSSSVCNV